MLGGLLLSVAGVRHRQSAPTADDITISVAPGDTVAIPFSGSDPDGDLFGFFPTSDPSPADGGTLTSICFCGWPVGGGLPICSCSSTFEASPTFSGTVTFTYRAVDWTGLQSADATVSIIVAGFRTPQQILDEIRHIIERALIGGLIKPNIANSLRAKVLEAATLDSKDEVRAADRVMHAFSNEVEAQTGKGIDPSVAALLLQEAEDDDKAELERRMVLREGEWETFLTNFYGAGNEPPERVQCLQNSLAAWRKVIYDPRVFEGNKLAVYDAADEEFSTCAHGSHPDLTGNAGGLDLNIKHFGPLGAHEINDLGHDLWAKADVTFEVGYANGFRLSMRAKENGQNWWGFDTVDGLPTLHTSTRGGTPRVADGTLFKIQGTVTSTATGTVTTKIRLIYLAP